MPIFRSGRRTCGGVFDDATLAREIAELEAATEAPDFWKDQAAAQRTMQRRRRLEDDRALVASLARQAADLAVLLDWAKQGEDVTGDLAQGIEAYARDAGFREVEVAPIDNDFWRFHLLRP